MERNLDNLGRGGYDPEDFVDMSMRGTSGRGYAGAEGYAVHLPRSSRCPAAE